MNRCSLLSRSSRSAFVAPLINCITHHICLTFYVYQHHNILKTHQLPSRLYLDSSPPIPANFLPLHGTILQKTTIFINSAAITSNLIMASINSNQLMHISVFIKNTLKVYLKFLLPRHVSDHIGIHPQGAIIRS